MALIIPDLFTPYINGRRQAIADNWTDMANYNAVQKGQIDNLEALGSLAANINKAYEETDYWALRNLSNQYQLDMLARTYPYLVQNNIRNLNAVPQFNPQFNQNSSGGGVDGGGSDRPKSDTYQAQGAYQLSPPGDSSGTKPAPSPQETPELTITERLAALNLLPANGGKPFAMDQTAINGLMLAGVPRDLSNLGLTANMLDQVPVYDTRTQSVLTGRTWSTQPVPIRDENYTPISRDSLYTQFNPDILNKLTPGQLYITGAGDNGYTGLYTDAQGQVFQLTFDRNNVITGRTPVDMKVLPVTQGGL